MTSQELRDWRKAIDLAQEQAAHALGVTLRAYANWEVGEVPIANRVELAAKMYLRIHRSRHGSRGAPLFYFGCVFESEDNPKPEEQYILIARREQEAVNLIYAEIGAHERAIINVEAVADAPTDATPRVIGTIAEVARRKRNKFI
jgi:transcriptional regulator with XRE-family HTH domain